MKKIVAIGGGENGRILEDGTKAPYNTFEIDKEIVKLTEKEKPNFLFLCHAIDNIDIQMSYYLTMKKIYEKIFNCHTDILLSTDLDNKNLVQKKISWADIIYEGGGDTALMINLWKKSGFDDSLYEAYKSGKVISGISAGAVCWFHSCNSDSIDNKFNVVEGLNWYKLFITPHVNEEGRYESSKRQLKDNNLVGIMLSNCCALEILDNKYRIITSSNNAFALKGYYENENYYEFKINNCETFRPVEDLLNKK